MEQDPGGSQARQPQQSVTASGGFNVRQVVQLAVEGNYESQIVLNYNRSDLEELDEYLKRAMAAHETIAAFQETDVSVYGVRNMAGNGQEWTAMECSFSDLMCWKDSGLG